MATKKSSDSTTFRFLATSGSLQEDVESVDIIPAIKLGLSAITLFINGIEDERHGSSFWKFNVSLIDDETYVSLITDKYCTCIEEGREIEDPRVLWTILNIKFDKKRFSIVNSRLEKEKQP